MESTDKLHDFDYAKSLEWLETNGLGGYASGTVSGAHSRRYHGLLIAATHPPVGRMVLVSKLEETIIFENNHFELSANQYPGAVHPKGYEYLESFSHTMFPEFCYNVGEVKLKKTIAAVQGENTTLVLYEVLEAPKKFTLELLPLYSCRDFHSLTYANDGIGQPYLFDRSVFRTVNYHGCPEFFISVPKAAFTEQKAWYYNFEYNAEMLRGLDYKDDLYTHGKFSLQLKQGDKVGIIISTEDPTRRDAFKLFAKEKARRETLIKDVVNQNIKTLHLAADQFIVQRGKLSSIIAGYHWFADWGRDTMISLPGICLVTGKFTHAKKILQAFSESISEGMLPNRFSDYDEAPEYNTVDATLWFFYAIYKYYLYTNDKAFIIKLLPVLKDIIDWHYKGTRYNIHVDEADGLLYAGQDGVQLTWMDAKIGDWVVTPRRGKAVEINALWYNALCIMKFISHETGDVKEASAYHVKAGHVATTFASKFWNENLQCLYDYIDGEYKNDDIRPNQIFALSLPFPLLSKDKAEKVFDTVTLELLTPRGLRSLSPANRSYQSTYAGDGRSRDSAYHQGTAWSFLLGPYVDALMYLKGEKGKPEATQILTKFFPHLQEAGVGTVSEIFDGNSPYTPCGCIAQAWGVAELLRVAAEHKLAN